MKIEKVTYQKTYSIGPYLTDRVGFEAVPEGIPGDNPMEILTWLEEMADEWHRKAHPHLYQEPVAFDYPGVPKGLEGSPTTHSHTTEQSIGVIDLNQERMEIAIDNCMCEDELKQWKKANPVIPVPILKHYNAKLKELTQ